MLALPVDNISVWNIDFSSNFPNCTIQMHLSLVFTHGVINRVLSLQGERAIYPNSIFWNLTFSNELEAVASFKEKGAVR